MATDPEHWLTRLSARAWLAAAEVELSAGEANLGARRSAITHARRAAGMALNGVLVRLAEESGDLEASASRWGRSYVDHLRALAAGEPALREPLPPEVGEIAAALLEIPLSGERGLVQLSAAPHAAARQALAAARALVDRCDAAIADLRRSEA